MIILNQKNILNTRGQSLIHNHCLRRLQKKREKKPKVNSVLEKFLEALARQEVEKGIARGANEDEEVSKSVVSNGGFSKQMSDIVREDIKTA